MDKQFVFIHSSKLDQGGYPNDCPFSSKRAGKTLEVIDSLGITGYNNLKIIEPEPVPEDLLLKFHLPEYIQVLKETSEGTHNFKALKMGLGTPDCPVFKDMFAYSSLAAGGTVKGASLLLEKKADVVFNPSGGYHHAHPAAASGFCYINDVVLATTVFVEAGKKVMIIDVDAHHLDAVQNAFYETDMVTTVSFHESGKTLFPGTGEMEETGKGKGAGYTINVPLPVGTYDRIYKRAFDEIAMNAIKRNKPDILILELGMDGLAGDPLAHLNLTNNLFADIVDKLNELNIPMLITGGGGYNVEDTVRGWALCLGVLVEGGQDDLLIGAGLSGVMLENTAWFGGLRDRTLLCHGGYREEVDAQIERIIAYIKDNVFNK